MTADLARVRRGAGLLLASALLAMSPAPASAGAGQGPAAPQPAAAVAPSPPPVDEAIRRAEAAARDGREAEALAILRDAAKGHPEWPPVAVMLARIDLVLGQGPAARRALERAAAEAPDDPRVYLELAGLALADGRLAEAKLDAEAAQARLKSPGLGADAARVAAGEVASALAAVAEARGDWPTALGRLRELLAIDAKPAARRRLARALVAQKDTAAALKELTQATKDDPTLGPPGVEMARLVAGTGDAAKVDEWFDYAAKVDPRSAAVPLARARWRVERGRPAEAGPLLDQAARLDPTSKEVEPLRGLAAWHARDLAAAERIYEARHRAAPLDEEAANTLALILVEQADEARRSRGAQLAEANARQFPRSAEVLATAGRALDRQGRHDAAEAVLRELIQKSGGQASPSTAFFLADVLAARGQADEARRLVAAALAAPGAFAYRDQARRLLAALDAKPAAPGR